MKYNSHEEVSKWIDLYSDKLLDKALFLLTNEEDAKDIVQEVFINAYLSFSTFGQKSNPYTWLCGILSHKISDFYRKKYRTVSSINLSQFFDYDGNWTSKGLIHYNEELDEDNYDFQKILEECLESLPDKWKIIFKLYYLQEKKTIDISKQINISTSNIWKIMQRSRLQIRECIEQKKNKL